MTENLPEPMTTPFSEELARATFGHIVSQHPNVSHHRRRMGLIYQQVSEGKARIDPADRQKLEDFHADIYRQTWISLYVYISLAFISLSLALIFKLIFFSFLFFSFLFFSFLFFSFLFFSFLFFSFLFFF